MGHESRKTKQALRRATGLPAAQQKAAGAKARTILLHFHIFKNGGSTLDTALKKNLGPAWREIEGDDPDEALDWAKPVSALNNDPTIKAISSHTARYPAPLNPAFRFIPLFLIRHPIDRLNSIYHFEKKRAGNNFNKTANKIKANTLADFIGITLARYPHIACDPQTSALARAGTYYFPPSKDDLARAKAIVAEALVPGVVERMDQYLAMLEQALTPHFPDLDLACPDENRNPTRKPSLLARLREIRDSLPSTLWRELYKRNQLDLELWRFTYRLARDKFSQMPHASKRLASFPRRKKKSLLPADLPWTGERLVASARGDFVAEHLHRYALALEFARQVDVLDVACGEGYGSAFLAKVARSVLGVDCDAPTVAHAAAKYHAKNLRFAQGRAEKLPLPAHSIDLVVSFETLEHLDDHEAMLREIKRVLRPGGRFLISTPDSKPYRKTSGRLNPFHLHELDLFGFRKLLSRYFDHVTVGYQRSVSGSWIAPLDVRPASSVESVEYSGNFHQVTKVKSGANAPYLIAVASDQPVPVLPTSLFNFSQEVLAQLQALNQERDVERKAFSALSAELDERTAWAKSLDKELQTAKDNFEKLTKDYAERTAWAKGLNKELQQARNALAAQTSLVEERTAWAKSLEKDLLTAQDNYAKLTKEYAERTAWAKGLDAELQQARKVLAAQTSLVEERSAWAKSLDAELQRARDAYQEQAQATAELSQDRNRLNAELAELGQLKAKLEQELTSITASCAALAPLLPAATGKGVLALMDQSVLALANLQRDLAAKNAEINAARATTLETQLRAEVAESDVLRLTAALKEAQLHLDGLLLHAADLQQRANSLAASKQDVDYQLNSSFAALQATRLELARYESRLICRLAARAPAANSPTKPLS